MDAYQKAYGNLLLT